MCFQALFLCFLRGFLREAPFRRFLIAKLGSLTFRARCLGAREQVGAMRYGLPLLRA